VIRAATQGDPSRPTKSGDKPCPLPRGRGVTSSTGGHDASAVGTLELPGPVTCREAIGDLPRITGHLSGRKQPLRPKFDKLVQYPIRAGKLAHFAEVMRNWPGFENRKGLWDHVVRRLPRDIDTFREMPNGGEYPAAHATAMAIWRRQITVEEFVAGRSMTSREKEELKRAIVPPYTLDSFPNRWWKLRKDYPSRTLMAHIGKDTYSHIHYDSSQARVISIREAARLQSFPDGFRFCGSMNAAYRQIGNAVPPLWPMPYARV
jgi:DNA (cytosine-5)-methyltransferase 1